MKKAQIGYIAPKELRDPNKILTWAAAVVNNNISSIQRFIDTKEAPPVPVALKDSLPHIAIRNKNHEMLALLIKAGAKLKYSEGEEILKKLFDSKNYNYDLLKHTLEITDIYVPTKFYSMDGTIYSTACIANKFFAEAISTKDSNIVKLFIEKGARTLDGIRVDNKYVSYSELAYQTENIEIFKLFPRNLVHVINSGDIKALEFMLSNALTVKEAYDIILSNTTLEQNTWFKMLESIILHGECSTMHMVKNGPISFVKLEASHLEPLKTKVGNLLLVASTINELFFCKDSSREFINSTLMNTKITPDILFKIFHSQLNNKKQKDFTIKSLMEIREFTMSLDGNAAQECLLKAVDVEIITPIFRDILSCNKAASSHINSLINKIDVDEYDLYNILTSNQNKQYFKSTLEIKEFINTRINFTSMHSKEALLKCLDRAENDLYQLDAELAFKQEEIPAVVSYQDVKALENSNISQIDDKTQHAIKWYANYEGYRAGKFTEDFINSLKPDAFTSFVFLNFLSEPQMKGRLETVLLPQDLRNKLDLILQGAAEFKEKILPPTINELNAQEINLETLLEKPSGEIPDTFEGTL